MLLPSSIHRAEALVGMAIPMVALSCASAPPSDAAAAKPASASASNVVFGLVIFVSLPSSHNLIVRHGQELRIVWIASYELASLTSGSARPRAAASIRKVRPCSGSAARAASSMPCQADVTSRHDRSGPTKAGQLDWRAGTCRERRCAPAGLYTS